MQTKPIKQPLRKFVRQKLIDISRMPASKAKEYDTSITWAFFRASR